MPQMWVIAFRNVARTSPTLPPSAMIALPMQWRMAVAGQHHADIVEDRIDRRVRLVDGDFDRAYPGKRGKNGIRHGARRTLQELVVLVLEGGRRRCDHLRIG